MNEVVFSARKQAGLPKDGTAMPSNMRPPTQLGEINLCLLGGLVAFCVYLTGEQQRDQKQGKPAIIPAEVTFVPKASRCLNVQTPHPKGRSVPTILEGGQDHITSVTPASVDPDGVYYETAGVVPAACGLDPPASVFSARKQSGLPKVATATSSIVFTAGKQTGLQEVKTATLSSAFYVGIRLASERLKRPLR